MLLEITLVVFILLMLLSVAFFTLLERNVLGLTQTRVGPTKVTLWGLAQPMIDGANLFTNVSNVPQNAPVLFIVGPSLLLILAMVIWLVCLPTNAFSNGLLVIAMMLSMMVYASLLTGYASISKYALIGAVRACAQTVSYEVGLIVLLLSIFVLDGSLQVSRGSWKVAPLLPLLAMWLIMLVAEASRAPFDFSEGESELISGLQIELATTSFILVFLGEYSIFTSLLMLTTLLFTTTINILFPLLIVGLILTRAACPRYRYDLLISICWLALLPASVCYLGLVLVIVML